MIIAFQSIAIFNLIFLLFKDRHALRIDLDFVYKFMSAMCIITLLKLTTMYGNQIQMFQSSPRDFLLVGLEDLAFGGTLYVFEKFVSNKKIFLYPLIIIVSLIFGQGHLAYSPLWALGMCFLPWFVFVRYGKKHGILSTIVCHTIFDILTFFTVKLALLLSL